MLSLKPSKKYALLLTPNLSVVSVAPLTVPLFPFPELSIALPVNGHHPTNPLEGTYDGTC